MIPNAHRAGEMKHTAWDFLPETEGAYPAFQSRLGVHAITVGRTREDQEAVARLAAAAPELLEAAKAAEKQIAIWRETGQPDIPKFMDAQELLLAAISKATP